MTGLFELERPRLLRMARRMLLSDGDADDAVQTAWLRASRSDLSEVASFPAWVTTTLARLCIDMLRSRQTRREEPIESLETNVEPPEIEEKLALAEAVQGAMAMVFDTLGPAERVAFIMHDVFDLEFDEISRILKRSTVATRQLASRARRRLRAASSHAKDLTAHRRLVEAYLDATRAGDFDKILTLLHPEVELTSGCGAPLALGAASVARKALSYSGHANRSPPAQTARLVLADGKIAMASFGPDGVSGLLVPHIVGGLIRSLRLVFEIDLIERMDIAVL